MDVNAPEAVSITVSAGVLLWKIVDWSLARNVKKADDENEKRDKSLVEFQTQLSKLKEDLLSTRNDVANLSKDIGGVRELLGEIRHGIENSRDKQAEFYRTEIVKLEQSFRQEITRAYNPEALMKVKELEKRFEELLSKPRKR